MDYNITQSDGINQADDIFGLSHDEHQGNCADQSLPIIANLSCTKGVIYCYVLSMWDNIVGPKAVYAWKSRADMKLSEKLLPQKNHESQSISSDPDSIETAGGEVTGSQAVYFTDVIKYVAEHSISVGDVNKLGEKHVTSWLTAPHQNIAFFSVRFALEDDHSKVPCSLSCITYYGERHKLRPYLEMCLSQMQVISNKISILFRKEGLQGVERVSGDLLNLTTSISSLMRANLSTCLPNILPENPVNRHLATLMLTSHLQTRSSTLIIASSLNVANKVILWLSQFSLDKNLHSSCLCLSKNKCLYSNGPYIQAVIRDCRGEVDLPTTSMLCAGLPLTIVDLTRDTVRQFAPSASQQRMCIQALHTELVDLYGGCRSVGAISRSIFRPVEVVAPLVKNFLQEWSCLAECESSVRREYLNTFKQSLYYSALSVSVFVRNNCRGNKYDDNSTDDRRQILQDVKRENLLAEIKSFLQLDESDIRVLLAKAEAFDPGITSLVFK